MSDCKADSRAKMPGSIASIAVSTAISALVVLIWHYKNFVLMHESVLMISLRRFYPLMLANDFEPRPDPNMQNSDWIW